MSQIGSFVSSIFPPGLVVETVTGNTGGAISPNALDNLFIVGDGTIVNIAGNAGTHTLTASVSDAVPTSFITSPATGTAIPSTHVLTFAGSGATTVSTAGSTVTIASSGTVASLTGNSGGAVTDLAGNINVLGDTTTINIAGNAGTHTLTASVTGGTDGQFLIAATAGSPIWASITAGTNITLTPGANSLSIAAAGITTINGDSGSATGDPITFNAASQAGATINFSAAASTVSFNVTDASFNTLMGKSAGGSPSSNFNTAFGGQALQHLTSGSSNSAFGLNALNSVTSGGNNLGMGFTPLQVLTTGGNNVAFGNGVLASLVTGSYNFAAGFNGGISYTGAESSNICLVNTGVLGESNVMRLGTTGAGSAQVNKTYIAGITGVNVGSVSSVVSISGDQLGSTTITAGANISVTPGANTITIAATGVASFAWSKITADQAFTVDNGFICNKAGLLTLTLPTTTAVGDIFEVTGINTNVGWRIAQNANQQIHFGNTNTTSGATGYLESTNKYDSVRLITVVANLEFNVLSSIGNPTIA